MLIFLRELHHPLHEEAFSYQAIPGLKIICKLCLINTYRYTTEVPRATLEVAQIYLKHILLM